MSQGTDAAPRCILHNFALIMSLLLSFVIRISHICQNIHVHVLLNETAGIQFQAEGSPPLGSYPTYECIVILGRAIVLEHVHDI